MFLRPRFNSRSGRRLRILIACCTSVSVLSWACSHSLALTAFQKEPLMSSHASGTFEVKLTPQTDSEDATLGRMTIDKQLHGDLEATSKGQMLTGMTEVKGSAGYVAIE